MAKIFLDTNKVVDILGKRDDSVVKSLENNQVFMSVLSVHIFCYAFKVGIPEERLAEQLEVFLLIGLNESVLTKAMRGPTNDLEDNIQLHNGAEAGCDIFLTSDKKLLQMKFFGMMRIENKL